MHSFYNITPYYVRWPGSCSQTTVRWVKMCWLRLCVLYNVLYIYMSTSDCMALTSHHLIFIYYSISQYLSCDIHTLNFWLSSESMRNFVLFQSGAAHKWNDVNLCVACLPACTLVRSSLAFARLCPLFPAPNSIYVSKQFCLMKIPYLTRMYYVRECMACGRWMVGSLIA